MMMGQQTMVVKRTLLLLSVMVATLIAASGVALAVNKVCSSGTTQANPCSGTTAIDTLIGTNGPDYIQGLAGNDKISGGGGADITDGGGGNDTYSYRNGWGQDTLKDTGGSADALNFSALAAGTYVEVYLTPERGYNYVTSSNGEFVFPTTGSIVEKITGSSGYDIIETGGAANTLQPGPGTGGAILQDYGGCASPVCSVTIPVSNDTYSGLAASGYGQVEIEDFGGTTDKLVLPFASTDAYFEAFDSDSDPALDDLFIYSSSTDKVFISGQLEPRNNQKGHIEQIVFTDGTMTIGSETAQAQTLSAEAQVEKLNEASNLDEAEKEKRKEAAKKAIEEAEKKR